MNITKKLSLVLTLGASIFLTGVSCGDILNGTSSDMYVGTVKKGDFEANHTCTTSNSLSSSGNSTVSLTTDLALCINDTEGQSVTITNFQSCSANQTYVANATKNTLIIKLSGNLGLNVNSLSSICVDTTKIPSTIIINQ